jgi:hypothetical protein
MTFNPTNSIAPFLQTSVFFPEEFEPFRVKFLQLYRDISNIVNVRQIGIFDLQEFLTGEQWFTSGDPQKKRQTYRKTFSIGAIATGATSTTAHGITGITAFTHIYGTCVTDVVDYRPIPYASVTAVNQQIEIRVDATNITIINGAASPNITSALVVLEYLKS